MVARLPPSNPPRPSRGSLSTLCLLSLLLGCGGPEAAEIVVRSATPGAPRPAPVEPSELDDGAQAHGEGRWFAARQQRSLLSEDELDALKDLESVGYLNASLPAETAAGVVRHDPDRAFDGLNFFTSGHAPEALLMDMQGTVLHRWHFEYQTAWPEAEIQPSHRYFRRAYLFENGDVLAIFEGHGMVKIDSESRLLWEQDLNIHHDLEVLPDGTIWTLDREANVVPSLNAKPILEDFLVLLSPAGEELRRVSLLEALQRSEFSHLYDPVRFGDIFHTNTVEVLTEPRDDGPAWLGPGHVLTSFRHMSTLAIVDIEEEVVVKAWTGSFLFQHEPTLLPSGNILFFDNDGAPGKTSRAIEFDPKTDEVVWSFSGTEREPLFTATCGLASRLPNGNTLLVESDAGRTIEVTSEGDIVWEFISPYRSGKSDRLIAAIPAMARLPRDFPYQSFQQNPDAAGETQEGAR